jgi:hypothetical protein
VLTVTAVGFIISHFRSPQRRDREEQYEQRFGPLGF